MSMCKLHTVKSARKAQGKCRTCGTELGIGTGYRWWQGRYTAKHVVCLKASCTPAAYERETNPLRAEHMQAEEAADLAMSAGSAADAILHLEEAQAGAENLTEQLQERLDGWSGTGLENGPQAEACENSRYELELWATEAENILQELRELDEPDEGTFEDDSEYEMALLDHESELAEIVNRIEALPELDLGA